MDLAPVTFDQFKAHNEQEPQRSIVATIEDHGPRVQQNFERSVPHRQVPLRNANLNFALSGQYDEKEHFILSFLSEHNLS